MKKFLAVFYIVAFVAAVGIVLGVNYNAHTKNQALTSNEMKVAVQPAPDSGLEMCKQMADRTSMPAPRPKLNYDQVSTKFQFSQHGDVREAGLQLVGTLQRVDKALQDDNTDLTTSMGAVMALRIAWGEMQNACRNHGVDVPDLPS
jgi:hypothetical protein